MRIASTKTSPAQYEHYAEWLRRTDPGLDIVSLQDEEHVEAALAACDGLLLPGGGDVDPERFARASERDQCRGVDRARDEREFTAIRAALGMGMPVLGICRGLQVMNVALGGTLIIDLPAIGCEGHGERSDGGDAMHHVLVRPDTLLSRLTGAVEGYINSSHHQSAGLVAPRLTVSAQTADGVVEALEWAEPVGKPWLLLVQWHPERMADGTPSFRDPIATEFITAVHTRRHSLH